ncbi:MAG: hypothetical protein K8T10_00635 [Candidatus Eremiobacteraeota bacterium]|nr:hypothetical protein [Candidatus Eremiobacteraeota bacterium]
MDGMANASAQQQMVNSDQNQAQTVGTQMQADNQKQQMRRWQIMQDSQTKKFEIQQDVTVNKAKTGDKMFSKWDQYIRS